MIALLLAAAATPPVETAERAFASMAQTSGQWTAFRAFAAPDAVMFSPGRVRAQEWLAGRKDPATSVMWWPAKIVLPCDGSVAVTTGSWVAGRARGYFTTVWERRPDGTWKWIVDSGDDLDTPRAVPEKPQMVRAKCGQPRHRLTRPAINGLDADAGLSRDGTLLWMWANEGRVRRLKVYVVGIPQPVIADEIKTS